MTAARDHVDELEGDFVSLVLVSDPIDLALPTNAELSKNFVSPGNEVAWRKGRCH